MYLIAGLGNPTKKYEGTRHNVGFEVLDRVAAANGIRVDTRKHKALVGSGYIGGVKVVLAKPQTFMNLSGESIREIVDFYKIEPENVVVIYDDISLDVGQLRIREKGSAGGHNGMKNIILHLGSQVFTRIKVGVGEKPDKWDLADYVLGRPDGADRKAIDEAEENAALAVELIVSGDTKTAMNRYNSKKKG